MLLLTILVTFGTVLGVQAPEGSETSWYISPLLISAGATGAFLSDNIISFFAFHELALIPTFVMIGFFGRGDKRTTAWRATLYLGLASMVLLVAILMLGSQLGYSMKGMTEQIQHVQLQHAELISGLLLVGFGTLISLFPFHSWAAPAYASAPAPVAMMHAGVLKKFGLYGLFMLQPVLGAGLEAWLTPLLVLLVCNVIWVGYVTVNQKRLDLMLGNSSVMHMGYIFLAFAALVALKGNNPWAIQGAALLMLAHGLSIALLFLLCGWVERATGTLELGALGGLGTKLPALAFIFGIGAMASIGLPGLANFPGEFMAFFSGFAGFSGAFGPVQIATIFCLWGLVISAIYMLRAYRRIFQGDVSNACARVAGCGQGKCTLTHAQRSAAVFLAITLVLFGLLPNLVLSFFGN
jgi:NADH-quinone oxidoreductase subunit M